MSDVTVSVEAVEEVRPTGLPADLLDDQVIGQLVELATAEWVDWYNHRRLHGEIGHVPPVEYETNYYLATAKPLVTAII